MIETIEFEGEKYPLFQTIGNSSQFALPYAKHLCVGTGYDIGYCKNDWKLEGAIGIDKNDDSPYDAYVLPEGTVDYIYSSHCLEHLKDWVGALEIWVSHLSPGGVLFLYLPHKDQKYWKPWNNRKHLHSLDVDMVSECISKFGIKNIFWSERDLNHSFIVVGEKE